MENNEKIKQETYEKKQKEKLRILKLEPNKYKRFFKILYFYIKAPFLWFLENIKDWRTAIIFAIVFLLVSSEVWVFYLLGIISIGTSFSAWCFSIASACWLWWLLPVGSPFVLICISLTIFIKAIFNKIRFKKLKK